MNRYPFRKKSLKQIGSKLWARYCANVVQTMYKLICFNVLHQRRRYSKSKSNGFIQTLEKPKTQTKITENLYKITYFYSNNLALVIKYILSVNHRPICMILTRLACKSWEIESASFNNPGASFKSCIGILTLEQV